MAVLFEITHATGDTSEYDALSDPNAEITVGAGLAFTSFGLDLHIDDTDTFTARKDFSESASTFNIRWYFDPNSSTLSESSQTIWIKLSDMVSARCHWVLRKKAAGDYETYVEIIDDLMGSSFTSWVDVTDAPHYFEIAVTKGTGANGEVKYYQDGVLEDTLSSLDIDGLAMDELLLGVVDGAPTTGGLDDHVLIDQIKATDDGVLIGAHIGIPRKAHLLRMLQAT